MASLKIKIPAPPVFLGPAGPSVPSVDPIRLVAKLPVGRYFLGDICYIMKDHVYNWWTDVKGGVDGLHTISDDSFVVVSADGDGLYPVTINIHGCIQETQFCTDANNFGLVPTHLMDPLKEKDADAQVGKSEFVMGRKFIFRNPVKYYVDTITNNRIITDGDFTITIHFS